LRVSTDGVIARVCTLSLHDALPILSDDVPRRDRGEGRRDPVAGERPRPVPGRVDRRRGTTPDHHVWLTLVLPGAYCTEAMRRRIDRKSTRLNSSHQIISYAVFCLKK